MRFISKYSPEIFLLLSVSGSLFFLSLQLMKRYRWGLEIMTFTQICLLKFQG